MDNSHLTHFYVYKEIMVYEKYTDPEEGGPAKQKGSQKVDCSANFCKINKILKRCIHFI